MALNDFSVHRRICQILNVSTDELSFETDNGSLSNADILYVVWDHMIERDITHQKHKWVHIVSVVYSSFLHSDIPTMTDVLEAASRGGRQELVDSLFRRAEDAPSDMHDWVVKIPGLMLLDDSPQVMTDPYRLGQMQNAAWACEADEGFRYWPESNGEGFDNLIELFHSDYIKWCSEPISNDDMELQARIEEKLDALFTSNSYIAKKLMTNYGDVYSNYRSI